MRGKQENPQNIGENNGKKNKLSITKDKDICRQKNKMSNIRTDTKH